MAHLFDARHAKKWANETVGFALYNEEASRCDEQIRLLRNLNAFGMQFSRLLARNWKLRM